MVDPDRVITLTLPPAFLTLYEAVRKQHPKYQAFNPISEAAAALDPGETTGVAEFDGKETIRVYQKLTNDIGQSFNWLKGMMEQGCSTWQNGYGEWHRWEHIRCEDYRVYQWKTADHAWSPVHTIQWIGAIRVVSHITGIPLSFMMAQQAKAWWTDEKLNQYGLNPKGLKHGRDALRHLLYYILFPSS